MNNKNKVNKIIVVDLLYLGDLLFAHPFLENLRANFPDAKIEMVVNHIFADIMAENKSVDQVYAFNKGWSTSKSIKFARKLKQNNYQLGINIHGNWRSTFLMSLINPAEKVGIGGFAKDILLDRTLQLDAEQHMVKQYLTLLDQLNLKVDYEVKPALLHSKVAEDSLKKILQANNFQEQKTTIGLNTGGSWPTKRWPASKFASLADMLIDRYQAQIVLLGGPGDRERSDKIEGLMRNSVINLAGETSLQQLAALLRKLNLVISNDSGPVHVAVASGTKTLTIFGPSDEKKYKPLGQAESLLIKVAELDCRPCGEHQCPLGHHRCMEDIEPEDIVRLLEENGWL